MITVFTPLSASGNAHIYETYLSLKAQRRAPNWEWVILPNHGGRVPVNMTSRRVRILPDKGHEGIGALKRACCDAAEGDIFVELDHDDLLTENALRRIQDAVDRGAGFVYSDFAEFENGTWAPNVYSADFGWESYDFDYQGRALKAMRAPEATPQNCRRVEWAPNHVRAWTRQAYYDAGGHDPKMPVADDHDLVVRTLLSGVAMVHVPECLYLYRVHAGNTTKDRNAEIQARTQRVYDTKIDDLARFFADRNGLRKVDLCGGIDTAPGLEPWDLRNGINLDERWPAEDSSVGYIRAQDAIEHLKSPLHTMAEAHRVLAPGGFFLIEVPSTDGRGAWQDPTHVSFWNENSFWYYAGEHRKYLPPGYESLRFQVARLMTYCPSPWYQQHGIVMVRAHLICLKDGFKPMGAISGV